MYKMLAAAMAALTLIGPAVADEVTTEFQGRKLVAEATLAEGKTWADNAMLMVHGTLTHKDQETMVAMRELLKERGYNTLAVTLSLGLSDRRGDYDCAVPHTHRHVEALVDIGVWLTWLRENGATKVTLFGHSRGGAQVAWYVFERPKIDLVGPVVMLAPTTWDSAVEAKRYRERFGHGYEETLAQAQDMVKRMHGRDFLPQRVDFLNCPQAETTAFAFMEYYINDPRKDTPSMLPGVDRQALVVAAGNDQVEPDLVKKINARKFKHVELQIVEGADHMFLDDDHARQAADLIADFLKRQAAR